MKRFVSIPLLVVLLLCVLARLSLAADQNKQLTTADPSGKIFSLSECVAIALDTSPQILYSQADIMQKQYSLESSKKNLYPSFFFDYGYRYTPDAYEPYGVIEK